MIRTLHGIKHKYDLLNLSCTVVTQLTPDPDKEGSNLAGVWHEEKKIRLTTSVNHLNNFKLRAEKSSLVVNVIQTQILKVFPNYPTDKL